MALLEDTHITEATMLQFRFEAFNVPSHAQFDIPMAITTVPCSVG
jgi:hypothetical protein